MSEGQAQKLTATNPNTGEQVILVDGRWEPMEEARLGFLQRFGNDLKNRKDMLVEINRAYLAGEQSYAESSLQILGKVEAGAVLDFLGEVVISAGRGLSVITPDAIEDPIKGGATAAGMAFLNTKAGQAGLEAASRGVEAWTEFKDENPRAARNIEAVVDIALLVAPVKTRKTPATLIGKSGDSLLARSEKTAEKLRSESIEDLVRPKRLKNVREDEVSRTTEVGLFRQKTVELSPAEKEMVSVIKAIPGVSNKKTLQGNYNAISQAVKSEADSLKAALAKDDFVFSRAEFRSVMDDVAKNLSDNPLIVGDAAKVAEKIAAKMDDLVEINSSTGSGLLQARKELDAWARAQKGQNIFDPKLENAMSIALREIRQSANDFLAARATNVAVKDSLRRQSTMLRAMTNIAPKAADEAANALLRVWHKGLRLLPLRGEFNQSMAALFGVGGLGASALFAPMFTKIALGSFGTYFAWKFISGPSATKTLSFLLRGIDEMLRKTKDANMIRKLRADRALIIEIAKASVEED